MIINRSALIVCSLFLSVVLVFALFPTAWGYSHESSSSNLNEKTWQAEIKSSIPGSGCFTVSYPNTVWIQRNCEAAPTMPLTMGNGNDEVAYSSSANIGSASGSFTSVSGLTSESDSQKGSNYYSLQVNSQFFSCNTSYTGGKSATCWEQFVFINPGSGSGSIYIQYWLIGYHNTYGNCPSTGPPGGTSWMQNGSNCYANSASKSTPSEAATGLIHYSLSGQSSLCYPSCNSPSGPLISGQPDDYVIFCVSGTCYSVSVTMHVLNLYSTWRYAEFNVFGYCCSSQANFDSGTHLTVQNALENQQTYSITPSCDYPAGWTGETNNLNFGSCSSSSNGYISFTESN